MADTGSSTKRKLQKFSAKASDPIVSGFHAVQNVWSAWASLTEPKDRALLAMMCRPALIMEMLSLRWMHEEEIDDCLSGKKQQTKEQITCRRVQRN